MQVKVFLTISIDEDDYPIPSDGNLTEEVTEAVEAFIYDIDGMKVKNLKVIMEN